MARFESAYPAKVLTRWSKIPLWKQALLGSAILYVVWAVSEIATGHADKVFGLASLAVLALLVGYGALGVITIFPLKWLGAPNRRWWPRRKVDSR